MPIQRRPTVDVLVEVWEQLWPAVAELIATRTATVDERDRLLGLGLTAGTAIERLRQEATVTVPLAALRAVLEAAQEDLDLWMSDRATVSEARQYQAERDALIEALGVAGL